MEPSPSSYLQYLPEVFRAPSVHGATPFLGRYLNIFEALFTGRDDVPKQQSGAKKIIGLEEILSHYMEALDPAFTPVELPSNVNISPAGIGLDSAFLTYLASWLALTLDQNWDLTRRRAWVKRIVPLYQQRGTRTALGEYIAMFVGNQARVDEPRGFILGKVQNVKQSSTLGVDTFAGFPPYYFRVVINYGFPEHIANAAGIPAEPFEIAVWKNLRKTTRAVVDLEKPAHTHFRLDARTPGIVLGHRRAEFDEHGNVTRAVGRATLGRDTLIWHNCKPI
jgi:phage tail-like protein